MMILAACVFVASLALLTTATRRARALGNPREFRSRVMFWVGIALVALTFVLLALA